MVAKQACRRGTGTKQQEEQVYAGGIATAKQGKKSRRKRRKTKAGIRIEGPRGGLERELSFRYTEGAAVEKRLSKEQAEKDRDR